MAETDSPTRRTGAQTGRRAIMLLEVIAGADHPLGVADIARMLQLNKNAAYRLLRELEGRSMVAREADGRRYVPGVGLIALAAKVLQRFDVRTAARPAMETLSAMTSETVSLHIPHLRYRICIDSVESSLPIRRVIQLGQTLPLYEGATGKVMLAFLESPATESILEWAAQEGQRVDLIRAMLSQARSEGYLASIGDRVPGVGALAVPLFGMSGLIGAITVSGPDGRWSREAMLVAAPRILETCADLSKSLSGRAPAGGSSTMS